VGNFTVLLERLSGPAHAPRRELWLVVGPYWPFCVSLTATLMVGLPLLVLVLFWSVLPRAALLAFLALTLLSLAALAAVACRDPGLMEHVPFEPPASLEAAARSSNQKWVYNDLTESWRPRRAQYDRDVNAVVREFDHVCPFTGTAIGANNLTCFYAFVVAVQVLIYASLAFLGWGLYVVYTDGYTPPPH
jgi:palmitoyltransferase ZDHHC9/14/18